MLFQREVVDDFMMLCVWSSVNVQVTYHYIASLVTTSILGEGLLDMVDMSLGSLS